MSVDDYECTHRQFVCFDFEKDDDECPMEDDVVARQKCNHRRRRGVPALIARDSTPHGEMRRRAGCRHRTALKNMGQLVDLDSHSLSETPTERWTSRRMEGFGRPRQKCNSSAAAIPGPRFHLRLDDAPLLDTNLHRRVQVQPTFHTFPRSSERNSVNI